MNTQTSQIKKLLIATTNQAKFDALKKGFGQCPIELVSLADCHIELDVEETGTTLAENAVLKAQTYADLSGLPTLADDSGLEVDALNGQPGIYSSRYAGPYATDQEKVAFLLNKLKTVPLDQRTAYFRSAIALIIPGQEPIVTFGECKGIITTSPRGAWKKGFPYCVVFEIPEHGKTIAELLYDQNTYVDHRHQALQKLKLAIAH